MIRAGLVILFVSWVPLIVAGALGSDNPIGLGLLAWGGSAVAIVVLGVGVIAAVVRVLFGGRSDRPS